MCQPLSPATGTRYVPVILLLSCRPERRWIRRAEWVHVLVDLDVRATLGLGDVTRKAEITVPTAIAAMYISELLIEPEDPDATVRGPQRVLERPSPGRR